ncbi:MAG: universal stress protein [Pirellulales bacterium]|nr:universal stress protein [Pirellulales bacterium]
MAWLPKKCVVVPIDFSDVSFHSLDVAAELVDDPSHVHAIHVLPELPVTEPGVIWDTIDDENRMIHANEALTKRLAETDHQFVTPNVAIGDPGHEIARYAKDAGAELVVLPSHGRSGLQHLLMGSTTERVVRLAHCPVVVLK